MWMDGMDWERGKETFLLAQTPWICWLVMGVVVIVIVVVREEEKERKKEMVKMQIAAERE
jgi:heme/copper-type cytochrome/quinol oxidase subunit 2